jgi:hypothetical protein
MSGGDPAPLVLFCLSRPNRRSRQHDGSIRIPNATTGRMCALQKTSTMGYVGRLPDDVRGSRSDRRRDASGRRLTLIAPFRAASAVEWHRASPNGTESANGGTPTIPIAKSPPITDMVAW